MQKCQYFTVSTIILFFLVVVNLQEAKILYAPAKAANAGGVATSGTHQKFKKFKKCKSVQNTKMSTKQYVFVVICCNYCFL